MSVSPFTNRNPHPQSTKTIKIPPISHPNRIPVFRLPQPQPILTPTHRP
ncbi:hypothetical protein [Kingella oralis]